MQHEAAAAKTIRRAKARARRERFENDLAFQIRAHRMPEPAMQHRFAIELGRQWRFDFAWPQLRLAVEVEGLVVKGGKLGMGRHHTIGGMKDDIEKYNSATLLGWRLLRFHQGQIDKGEAIAMLERMLHTLGWSRGDRVVIHPAPGGQLELAP
jgi:very-short-patch-repair endonuclease